MTDKQRPKQNEQKDNQWLTKHYTEKGPMWLNEWLNEYIVVGPGWLNELGRCRAWVAQ